MSEWPVGTQVHDRFQALSPPRPCWQGLRASSIAMD
jgi:hypothetical protein